MNDVHDGIQDYIARFQARTAAPEGARWTDPMRERALARFAGRGFPTTKEEEWRHTNIAPLRKQSFGAAPEKVAAPDLEELRLGDGVAAELVFVNGRYAKGLSRARALPEGVALMSLAEAIVTKRALVEERLGRYADYETGSFAALNTAFFVDGAFVHVPEGARLEAPIHLIYLAGGGGAPFVVHPRTLVIVGPGAEAALVETYAGGDGETYFTNPVTEIAIGEDAGLVYHRVQRESETAYHMGTLQVDQKRNSRFHSLSVSLGGIIARTESNAVLRGEGIECVLDGVYLGRGEQLIDNHTSIDHAKPHCRSHELFKGILTDRAHGVFRGGITVRRDAQKTDAKQTNQVLLLSADATIHTKPQLEIYADDVRCTHGATVGQIDPESVFYLRSRGIDEKTARAMLVYAFAGDLVGRIEFAPLRENLEALLAARLPGGEAIGGGR